MRIRKSNTMGWQGSPLEGRGRGRGVCLVTPGHPERGLSNLLIQHLSQEIPDVEFSLGEREDVTALWICGYEPGYDGVVRLLRERHPDATLLLTGSRSMLRSAPAERGWESEVLAAGADHACGWPMPYGRLGQILRTRRGTSARGGRPLDESAPRSA